MEVRRLVLRRVNPFRGITHVVEIDQARAITTDGTNWELQVQVERAAGWGSLNLGRTETLYCRYAVWADGEDMARYPMHVPGDRARLQRLAQDLVAALGATNATHCGESAAAAADCRECWLLDAATQQPLAMLATAQATEALPPRVAARWRATLDGADGLAGFGGDAAAVLERQVARRGGLTAWFERLPDSRGRRVGAGDTASAAILPGRAFPELLLDESWPAADAGPVADYVRQLAPRLLMLPLAADTRQRLEQAAAAQPDAVAHFYRLYPAVNDRHLMNSLRVQARLNQAAR